MYLPPDFGAELDARTSDGGIRNELRVASQAEAEETPAPGGTTPMRTAAVRSADESAEAESF